MPKYEYRCEECHEIFVRKEHIGEHGSHAPTCPKCGSSKVEPLMSAFYAQTGKKS